MYHSDLVQRVINYYFNNNKSLRFVANLFQIGKSSVWRWINMVEQNITHHHIAL